MKSLRRHLSLDDYISLRYPQLRMMVGTIVIIIAFCILVRTLAPVHPSGANTKGILLREFVPNPTGEQPWGKVFVVQLTDTVTSVGVPMGTPFLQGREVVLATLTSGVSSSVRDYRFLNYADEKTE